LFFNIIFNISSATRSGFFSFSGFFAPRIPSFISSSSKGMTPGESMILNWFELAHWSPTVVPAFEETLVFAERESVFVIALFPTFGYPTIPISNFS